MIKIAAIILENDRKEILLYLRDNKPNIPFPHHWDLFGGHIEKGETQEEALERELKEELDIQIKNYNFFKKYEVNHGDVYPNIKYVFSGKINKEISELTLKEGEKLQFFPQESIGNIKFANVLKDIVMEYINSKKRYQ
jgi:8-oxo-dGTP diphosphatase